MSANPSQLPKLEEMQDILDIHDIPYWSATWFWVALGFVVAVAVAALLYFLWRRWKKNRPVEKLTPLEQALRDLERLKAPRTTDGPDAIRRFYFALSELFRVFLESERGIPATEATLEELKALLKSDSRELLRDTYGFLESAELAKFARWIPPEDELNDSVPRCRRLVQAWMPKVEEPA